MQYRVIALSIALAACGRLRFDLIGDAVEGPPGDAFTGMKLTYIKASNSSTTDQFGFSVALSADGNTLAVGAAYEDSAAIGIDGTQGDAIPFADSGAVYVFVRSGDTWVQQAYVKASNTGLTDLFGCVVALSADGNTLVVGAYQEDSPAVGINGAQGDTMLSGDSGAVYVFTRTGTMWSQQAYIKASNTDGGDQFSRALALSADGNTLAVGAYLESSSAAGIGGNQLDNSASKSGAVYIFTRGAGTWTQQEYIKASNPAVEAQFGWSVSLAADGNTLAVGAVVEDTAALNSGAAYVFKRVGVTWSQLQYFKAFAFTAEDYYGQAIALSADGSTLAVGAIYEDSNAIGIDGDSSNEAATNAGAAYVYVRNGDTFSFHAYVKASNTDAGDELGRALALSGSGALLVVGASLESSNAVGLDGDQSNNAALQAGAAYVLTRAPRWAPSRYIKATNPDVGDRFGGAIALTPDSRVLAITALGEASAATGINGDQTDNSAIASGAVYLIE